MKTKITKESRNLLIALLLGDGTISNNNVFKLSHCEKQRDYLEWKIEQLKNAGLRNNGLKEYISVKGYNIGKKVYYTQLNIVPFIKVLRRVFYKPYKKLGNRKLLNRLDAKGIAIWYMDDGHINVNTSKQRSSIQHTIKIATCVDESTVEVIIQYFLDVWNIKFRKFPEGKNTFSIASSSEEDYSKFVNLIKPFVEQVPSMLYKIRDNFTKKEFLDQQRVDSEARDS